MANPNDSQLIRFGVFEVDLQTGEPRKNGARVKLQQQPFQILLLLLQRHGTIVTREELRKQLWPSDTFVDFDHSLNAAIKRLRDALGESAESPIYIETLARRGYRFHAPVQSIPAHGSAPANSPPSSHKPVAVGAKSSAQHFRAQIPVGRRNQANIHLADFRRTDTLNFPVLNHAQQLGLHGQ